MKLNIAQFSYHDLERTALAFVIETETWPVFLEWAKHYVISDEMSEWLTAPEWDDVARQWMLHSPDEFIRANAYRVRTAHEND